MSGMWVVGIGASAGGVEALRELLPLLPLGDVAYVIAQHMSPTHPSLLIQVLARETSLRVMEVGEDTTIESGVVYVTPPNRDVTVTGYRLLVEQAEPRISPQPSVDVLLSSIAASHEGRGVGVILSGTGSDGTRGLGEIYRMGGHTLAQEPDTARYRDMPVSAIDSGVVEFVGDVQQLGEALGSLINNDNLPQADGRFGGDLTMAALATESRRETGWDLASYKDGTLMRQLKRRMKMLNIENTSDYLEFVRKDPTELHTLRDAMLINVTGFLRDNKSFDSLIRAVRDLVVDKLPGEPLRAWAAG